MRLRGVMTVVAGLLPASSFKNAVVRRLGWNVGQGCRIGPVIAVSGAYLSLEDGARVGAFNMVRGIRLELGSGSTIGSWNWFSAAGEFRGQIGTHALLRVGRQSSITSRHYVDCSGGVLIGDFTTVGGQRTTILSHGIDFVESVQVPGVVEIGSRSFVSTNCVLLMGSVLPERSVLAAGAVLTRSRGVREPGIWGGVPARHLGVAEGAYFDRAQGFVSVSDDEDPQRIPN